MSKNSIVIFTNGELFIKKSIITTPRHLYWFIQIHDWRDGEWKTTTINNTTMDDEVIDIDRLVACPFFTMSDAESRRIELVKYCVTEIDLYGPYLKWINALLTYEIHMLWLDNPDGQQVDQGCHRGMGSWDPRPLTDVTASGGTKNVVSPRGGSFSSFFFNNFFIFNFALVHYYSL